MPSAYVLADVPAAIARSNTEEPGRAWAAGGASSFTPNVDPPAIAR